MKFEHTLSELQRDLVKAQKSCKDILNADLVRFLAGREGQPPSFSEVKFLEAVHKAYCYVGALYQREWSRDATGMAPAVPLIEIYGLLTLLPGADREYSREDFAWDIHRLSSQPELRTKNGRRFYLTGSTGAKSTRQRLVVKDSNGRENIYVSIRFQKE